MNIKAWSLLRLILLLFSLPLATFANEIANISYSGNATQPLKPACTETNWSPSSAWWFLATLALGSLAHPRGSLIFNRAGRVWRLCPIYLVFEDLLILLQMFVCILDQGPSRPALRICSYSILALREGNAWCQGDYDKFFADEENSRYLLDDGEQLKGYFELAEGRPTGVDVSGGGMERDYPETSPVVRRATIAMEDGGGQSQGTASDNTSWVGRHRSISMSDWFTIGGGRAPLVCIADKKTVQFLAPRFLSSLEQIEAARLVGIEDSIADKKTVQFLDARFRRNLEQIEASEKGPTYRALLWLPMIQQLAKICLVSGAPYTTYVGTAFFLSFVIVEILLIAARSPLDRNERAKSMKLLQKWGRMVRDPPDRPVDTTRRLGISLKPATPNGYAMITIASILNLVLFCRICPYQFPPILDYSLYPMDFLSEIPGMTPWYTWPILLIPWFFALLFAMLLFLTSFLAIIYLFMAAAALPVLLAISSAHLIRKYRLRRSQSFDRESMRFAPAFLAVGMGVLAFLGYLGLGTPDGLSFDCSTTWKQPFYDFLG